MSDLLVAVFDDEYKGEQVRVELLRLNPLIAILGLAAGSAVGAVSGSASHAGINEDFMKEMATHLKTNSSALCVLVREHPESVLEELHQFGGKVLRSTLTHEDERKLLETLDHLKADMSF